MDKYKQVVKYLERKLTADTDLDELIPKALPFAGYSCRYTKEVWLGKSKRAQKFRDRINETIKKIKESKNE